jgi:site-specific recombinase XerD
MKTLSEWSVEFVTRFSGKTAISYQNTLAQFTAAIAEGDDINLKRVRSWLDGLTCAHTTKVKHVDILKSFFNWLTEQDDAPIRRSPLKGFKLPKAEDTSSERILEPEQVQALIDAAKGRDRLILETLYLCGVRVSELCGLRWRHLKGRKMAVYGKGSKTRSVDVPGALWDKLVEHRGGSEAPVFMSRNGNPLVPSDIHRIIKKCGKLCADNGIDAGENGDLWQEVSSHWMRHSCGTHSVQAGAPIHLVQQTLGHASLSTTGKYLHKRRGEALGDYLNK